MNFYRLCVILMLLAPVAAHADLRDSYISLSQRLIKQAQAAHNQGDAAKAAALAEQALAADPSNPDGYMLLGDLAVAAQNDENAARHFRSVVAIDPANRFAYRKLGEADVRREELSSAQDTLAELEKLCTDCEEYKFLSDLIASKSDETK
jgi:cytochrome c-type biogenesis protein CcmH/NrfG